MKEDINRKVDEALSSLDGLQRAETGPFYFSRLRHRMDGRGCSSSAQLTWRLQVLSVAVVLLNLFTLWHFQKQQKKEGAKSVATEYRIFSHQIY